MTFSEIFGEYARRIFLLV